MTNRVLIKRSGTANSVPLAGDLQAGELAINYADGNLFYKNSSNTVTVIASNQFVSVSGNVTGNYFIGNGSQLTGIIASAGAAITNGNSNVTVAANGNVTVGVTGIANVAVFTPTGLNITGLISATGNITGANINGNGSGLSSITGGNVTGQVSNALVAGTVYTNAQPNITSVGILSSVSVTGNITGGNLNAAGLSLSSNVVSALDVTANIAGGNITTPGLISATGNITGNYFIGNGSQLTGIATGSSTKISNGTSEANIGTSGGNANITIGGVSNVAVFTTTGLNITGNISASGNISSGIFYGGGNLGLDTEPVTQTFDFGNVTAAVDTIYALNVVAAPGDAVNGVNIIDYSIANTKLANSLVLTTPNIGAATGNSLSVTGNINAAGFTGTTVSVTGTVFADKITTVSIPQVLDDISNQCDGAKMVFRLTNNLANITSANITDSRNLQVAVNGLLLSPWIDTQTWPWFQTFAGFPTKSPGYRVISNSSSANITFYRSPAQGSQVVLTIINNSSTAQLRKYPYSATTIALGD